MAEKPMALSLLLIAISPLAAFADDGIVEAHWVKDGDKFRCVSKGPNLDNMDCAYFSYYILQKKKSPKDLAKRKFLWAEGGADSIACIPADKARHLEDRGIGYKNTDSIYWDDCIKEDIAETVASDPPLQPKVTVKTGTKDDQVNLIQYYVDSLEKLSSSYRAHLILSDKGNNLGEVSIKFDSPAIFDELRTAKDQNQPVGEVTISGGKITRVGADSAK